jgi:ribonuclease HII
MTTTPDLVEERMRWEEGHSWVAGLDEVGRGAWAGPVTVGVAMLARGVSEDSMPPWLRDSKQLSEMRRESIFVEVAEWCDDWSIGHASPEECDTWGMRVALRLASQRALAGLGRPPDSLLIDGPLDLVSTSEPGESTFAGSVHPIKGGDARCASVAAASVLAKVVRDRLMRAESEHFPAYGFERNKGYPSRAHRVALLGYGMSSIHRRSWSFAADLPWHGNGSVGRPRPGGAPRERAHAHSARSEGMTGKIVAE